MKLPILLDTCAALWSMNNEISDKARNRLLDAAASNAPVFVSPITAWELGLLALRGRFKAPEPPARWFERLLRVPGIRLAEMPPSVLLDSSFLPEALSLRDPADRIIVATAREFGFEVMTRDRALLDYAARGYLQAFAC